VNFCTKVYTSYVPKGHKQHLRRLIGVCIEEGNGIEIQEMNKRYEHRVTRTSMHIICTR